MKKKMFISLGLVIIIVLAVLYSFPEVTNSYYDTHSTIANNIGYLVKNEEVKMEFTADKDNLGSISLKIGTFKRTNLTTMDVQILDDKQQLVMQKSVDLMDVKDNEYYKISFDPYMKSRDKKFTIVVTSPDATTENSVALYTYAVKDKTTHLYINGEEQVFSLALRATYYNNFDFVTLIVLLYFIAMIFIFIIFIYKYL